ncbi:TPA: hypothetical protein NJF81_001055 [Pseudomonas aeruginosa]|nr:hypothetical protein [Pseudomonas aeruginosa]
MQQNENFAKQPEHAEAERPEGTADLLTIVREAVAGAYNEWKMISEAVTEIMEAHDRIVGELRAVIAQLRQHKNDYMDSGQETYRALQNEIREREAEIARLDGLVSGRTAERDAALARVAELEACGAPALLAAADYFAERAKGPSPGWVTLSAVAKELRVRADKAPVAQAQHSVPEEFSFEYRHPNGECHTVTVSREQVINEMPDFLFEALCSKFCNCEPVGETNVVECCCDEYAEEFKLIAAAPGNSAQHSVPEGWMLVECGIWTQEQVDEMQKTVARFRNSEFVDDRALAMAVADAGQCKAPEISLAELLAAAPGKEGG